MHFTFILMSSYIFLLDNENLIFHIELKIFIHVKFLQNEKKEVQLKKP